MTVNAWANRIVGEGFEAPDQILANPMNWRKHPKHQKDALRGILREVGWVQRIIINEQTGHLIDGHLRVEVALEDSEPAVPVIYVNLSPEEELIVLASLDSISALAETDQDMINAIIQGIEAQDEQLNEFLQSLLNLPDPEDMTGNTDDDDAPSAQALTASQPGDVWLLGDHRVMCGDGTNVEHVQRLCGGGGADRYGMD